MSTAPAIPFVSVEEYLKTEYEPRCEYLDGVLQPKAMSDLTHGGVQALLAAFLLSQKKKYGLIVASELHSRVTPTRYRIPDVCVLTRRPQDGKYADAATPPLFTIEIASQGEPWTELRGKLADHLAMGVSTVIIADPYNKTVMVATQAELLREIASPLIVNIEVPGRGLLQLDFDDLYSQL